MALIQWGDSLSVNIVEIDIQHQKLVGMINDLNDAMLQRKGKDILGKILNGLMAYATVHFATEERYFTRFAYSETDSHQKGARRLCRADSRFPERTRSGQSCPVRRGHEFSERLAAQPHQGC